LQARPDELAELIYFKPIFQPGFKNVNRNNIKSTGYVVDTLLACIWCVLNTETIDEAILMAVNLGSDTDTVASITGTLSSCTHLDQQVNPLWQAQLRNLELLNSFIKPFAQKEESRSKA